ncbi:unnamed protein product [Mytilus edulis]|uniref:Uncharacterized protein n=1 Tax=Mytilus edulis TaxID=6550 RepID=A0A8S3Q5P0_MYTED|nr:unnamed protein product [Mytilus edulis]
MQLQRTLNCSVYQSVIIFVQVQHLHLGRYVEMVKTRDFHDDLDIVTEVHSTSGDVAVKRPSADLDIFNPSRVIHATAAFATRRPRSWPWKQDRKAATFDKLQIPLPIQHPASIAISIYNSSPMSAVLNETLTEGDVVMNAQYKSDVAVKTSNEGDIIVNTPDKSDVVERVCFRRQRTGHELCNRYTRHTRC